MEKCKLVLDESLLSTLHKSNYNSLRVAVPTVGYNYKSSGGGGEGAVSTMRIACSFPTFMTKVAYLSVQAKGHIINNLLTSNVRSLRKNLKPRPCYIKPRSRLDIFRKDLALG